MWGALEAAGIDRLLIGAFSTWADNNQLAAYVLAKHQKIGALLAHRTGFVTPTLAARQLATLDHFSDGRLWVHIITGGSEADQARDGDFLSHDERYERTDEYLTVLKKVWESDSPFDHEGQFYKFKGAFSTVKPFQKPRVPISFGGSSDAALRGGGQACRHLCPVGRAPGQGQGDDRPRARPGRRPWPRSGRYPLYPSPSVPWWRGRKPRPGKPPPGFSKR